jgi:hypothetical protein
LDFDELKERVSCGEEFKFYYRRVGYWISQSNGHFHFTRESDGCSQTFETADALFRFATVHGQTFKAVWDELEF